MADDREQQTVVVAGGSKGIGLAIARRFSELGARVVIGARTPGAEAESLAGAEFVRCDMNDPDGPNVLIEHAVARGRKISVLVNCVGGGIIRPDAVNVTDEQWMEMLNRSFLYVVRMCRAAAPHMIDGQSSILNISSVSGQRAEPIIIDYAAAKAAVDSYTKSLSACLALRRIRVNAIAPGSIATPLWTDPGGLADQASIAMGVPAATVMETFAEQIPLGSFGEPDDIAGLALFLSGPEAKYITGANMRVDGGWIAAVR